MKDYEHILRQGAIHLNIDLQENQMSQLLHYCLELHKWNRKINLIAKNTPIGESLEKHFLDSLTLLPIINQYGSNNTSLLDIGAGAGFPGLVLKIANPRLNIILLEPRQKRAAFLRHIIRMLQLKDVDVLNGRIEDEKLLPSNCFFSFITSRALTEPAVFIKMILRLLKPGSYVVFMQSKTRVQQWFNDHLKKEFELIESKTLQLPFSKSTRRITLIQYLPSQSEITTFSSGAD